MATKTDQVGEFITQQLELLDDQITAIDNSKVMRAAQGLLEQKARLQSARRALLGAGNKMTGSGGTRVTQGEVVAWFKANGNGSDGYSAGEIAEAMGHTEAQIRSHLNRGAGERFEKHGSMWVLRDPEKDEEGDDEE